MIALNCDTCQHWDANLVRHRAHPESLCQCEHSADYRRYVDALHVCLWHSATAQKPYQSNYGDADAC